MTWALSMAWRRYFSRSSSCRISSFFLLITSRHLLSPRIFPSPFANLFRWVFFFILFQSAFRLFRVNIYRVFIRYCVFSKENIPNSGLSLFSPGVSVCTHTRQVEHQLTSYVHPILPASITHFLQFALHMQHGSYLSVCIF